MNIRKFIPLIVYMVVLFLIFNWAGGIFGQGVSNLSYSQVVELFREEQVKSFVVSEQVIIWRMPKASAPSWVPCCSSRAKQAFWKATISCRRRAFPFMS